MQKQLFLPFCWLDRPITALLPGVPLSCPLAVADGICTFWGAPLNCFCSGVRESELRSGANGAAQRADAEGRQSL
tara:strand:+ start:585 stop:809 length:225 start_codon:yes stop_codon:yes gene_type:complete